MADVALRTRVSTGQQDSENQLPEMEAFAASHGHKVTARYSLSESAWNGGKDGGEYRAVLQHRVRALHRPHRVNG